MHKHDDHEPQEKPVPRQCTAMSKQSGKRCRKPAMTDRTVCQMHGGKTPRGVSFPHFRHGRYSKLLASRPSPAVTTNLNDVPGDRQCGAKTRSGEPCKNWGTWPSGRCRMHGGKSYRGIGSPSFKHGWYSECWPYTMMRRRIQEQERLERYVAARMEEIHAKRAEKEAREKAREERFRQKLEQDGGAFLIDLCNSVRETDGDRSRETDDPQKCP